ncbi:MAG: TIGR03936 family radical SAM-associated protein [Candidatus Omnitrophica bacterium]|nr:TIGR03936 family radical SAM-associated protein [Candidatus Omnitrophota bacterium]
MPPYKINFTFAKKEQMRFISHLDLMRLFIRAMRRADFPLKYTQGFHPHPKFKIKRALKLGIESENEEAEVILTEFLKPEIFKKKLQEQLPEGIFIKEVILKE